jgi:hypothetical protein
VRENLLKELGKIVGPMAKIIFREASAKWELHRTSQSTLADFIELICSELNDPASVTQYRKATRQFL